MSGTELSVADVERVPQPPERQPLLSVRQASHTIDGQQILEGISFDVYPGEIFGIMGMSGSGKTTLLRLLIGLERPTVGRVFFRGEDMTVLDEDGLNRVRKSMGMCFQYSALFDSMTVAQNIAFAVRNRRDLPRADVERRVHELLDVVEMEGTENRMPADLSGGMKKRVGIARALMEEPALVLYDEPSSGLDPVMACNITGLIKRVSEDRGSTAVVVSHDVLHLLAIANRVLMLHEGREVLQGTPDDMRASEIPIVHRFVHGVGTGPGTEFCPAR